ncbi:hypothetical protein V5O48_014636, partial [Marasmius crinis-equi]
WERASVGVGGAGAGGLPAFRHRLELKDVRDVINESIGWELPDFVPFQATVNLVQLSLDDWPAPTQSCLSSVFENSWNVFEEIIQEVFQHHPRLLSLVRLLTFESYKACYDRTSEALLETLREEPDLLYTQRCHYLSTEKQLWADRFGAACGSAKADWTKEVELMAGRFVDVIPRQIEHKLNRAFAGNISERIRADVDDLPNDKAEGLMEEDKKIARKRAKLRDVVERLEQAEKLVMSFKGGGGGGGYDDSEEEEDSDVDLRWAQRLHFGNANPGAFNPYSALSLRKEPTRSPSPSPHVVSVATAANANVSEPALFPALFRAATPPVTSSQANSPVVAAAAKVPVNPSVGGLRKKKKKPRNSFSTVPSGD